MSDVAKQDLAPAPKPSAFSTDYVLTGWQVTIFRALLIGLVTLWAYWPAIHGEFLWDDLTYITQNPFVRDPDAIFKVWFQPGSYFEYFPIEQTLQVTEWRLWHTNPTGFHLVNIALHIINSLLVWRLLSKFGLRLAWIGGLIFAVHPMNVESVAWISEFKNCVSTIPFLCAACAWIDYEEGRGLRYYWLALGLFLVAILCKISVAPFALVILGYAWWKRGRLDWFDLWASSPFWLISLVAVALSSLLAGTFTLPFPILHTKLEMLPPPLGGFLSRLALGGLTAAFFLGKFFCPTGTTPMYPQWPVNPPSPIQFLPWFVAVVVVCWLWQRRKTWGRHVLLGLLFFLGFLAPLLGFVTTRQMSFTWVFDHFIYVPMIGLIGLVVAALEDITTRLSVSMRPVLTGIVTLAVVLLAFLSHAYAGAYTNAETLWTYAVQLNPNAWLGHNYLGQQLAEEGRFAEAKTEFETALRYRPDLLDARRNLGDALIQLGQVQEGIAEYRQGLVMDPKNVRNQNQAGIILAKAGRTVEALVLFQAVIQLDPKNAEAYTNMGITYYTLGKLTQATDAFTSALQINPQLPEAHNGLGMVLKKEGQGAAAAEQFATAVNLNPGFLGARLNLGSTLAGLGRTADAAAQFEAVLQSDPDNQTARNGLAQLGQPHHP